MSENSASCDIELIEDTISHFSEDEDIISPESVAPDDNSSSVHPQRSCANRVLLREWNG